MPLINGCIILQAGVCTSPCGMGYLFPEIRSADFLGDFTIGEDKVQILGGSFGDLMLSQDESAAIIEYGDLMIRMENMNADDLTASDFLFGDILEPIAVG